MTDADLGADLSAGPDFCPERRAELEARFRSHILVNVGDRIPAEHPVIAEAACDELSLWLLESFRPAWADLAHADGAEERRSAYLQAKQDWLAEYLVTDRRDSARAGACLDRLQALWQAWAGAQLTPAGARPAAGP